MPRFFIATSDHVSVMDDEGIDLADLNALRGLLRKTLISILLDEGGETGVDEFSARAFNHRGQLVMQARASFAVVDQ